MLALVEDESQALRVVRLALNDVDLRLGARLVGEVSPELQRTTVDWIDALEIPLVLKCECWAISHSKQAISRVLKALNNLDNSEDVRWRAAEALGKIGGEQAVAGLLKALDDPNGSVRENAVKALGKIGDEQAVVASVLKMLDDPSFIHAAKALEKFDGEQAIAGLLKALDNPKRGVRARAASVLGKIGREQAVAGLLKVLDDPNDSVRWWATEALGKIGSQQAVAGLLKVLGDSEELVRWSAAKALGKIGGEQAIAEMLKALDDPNGSVREGAAFALGKIGSQQTVADLKALDDSSSSVREKAAEALEKIGGEQAVTDKALDDPNESVRERAAEALEEIGGEQAIAEMLKALDDPNGSIREGAAEALGRIGGEQAVAGLLKALDDPNDSVRWWATEALGVISGEREIAALWQARIKHPTGSKVIEGPIESKLGKIIAATQSRCKFYNYEIAQGLAPAGGSVQVFFSYASEDELLRDQLEKHLSALQRQDVVSSWCDRQILPGDDTNQTLSAYLNTADIILLLLSANSLASNKCYDLEIRRAMERHTAGDARVIPILLRPVDYEGLPLSKLPMLPPDGRFVTQWQNLDKAFVAIAEGVKEVAIEVRRVKAEGAIG